MNRHGSIRRCTEGKSLSKERGFVLLDGLVAMVIFMLGVLGMLGLQGTLTRAQSEAKYRADASFLASDLIGRMWSDTANLNGYSGSGCPSQPVCRDWMGKVAGTLPNSKGTVTVDASTGDVIVVVNWKSTGGDPHRYVTHTTIAKAGG